MLESVSGKAGTRVAFGDVVRLSRERSSNPSGEGFERYVGLDHLNPGDLRIRRWGDTSDGTTFTNVFRSGQVLFGKRRAYQRKVALADFAGVCSGDIYVLEPKNERLLPEFLPLVCQSAGFFEHAIGTSSGSLSPRTNWDSISSYEFVLPTPEEQRRIANASTAAVALIDALRYMLISLNAAEVGLFETLISGVASNALLPVEELLREPPRNGISPNANSDAQGLKTVSISAIRDGLFDPSGCVKYVNINADIAQPFFVQRGDAFVIRGNGNRQLCGRIGLSENSYDGLFYPDLLIRLRFDSKKILPEFAVAQWNLPSVHGRLVARAKSSNGIWKVNGGDIRSHAIYAPPITEQSRVLKSLNALRSGMRDARSRSMAVEHLKKKILTSVDSRNE